MPCHVSSFIFFTRYIYYANSLVLCPHSLANRLPCYYTICNHSEKRMFFSASHNTHPNPRLSLGSKWLIHLTIKRCNSLASVFLIQYFPGEMKGRSQKAIAQLNQTGRLHSLRVHGRSWMICTARPSYMVVIDQPDPEQALPSLPHQLHKRGKHYYKNQSSRYHIEIFLQNLYISDTRFWSCQNFITG